MISDVLSDAVAEIRRYRQEAGTRHCYSSLECKAVLDMCVATMEATRIYLDTPPQTKDQTHDRTSN